MQQPLPAHPHLHMHAQTLPHTPSRRQALHLGLRTLGAATLLAPALRVLPALADATRLQQAVAGFAAGQPVHTGRVLLDIAELVENGNAVPVSVSVESPMTAEDHVREIALFSELNPLVDLIQARLTPQLGRARLATRIRLATSQQLVALARLSDGSVWQHRVDVVVTLAACIES